MNRIPLPPKFRASLAVSVALFVPLAVFGGSALAKSSASQYQYSSPSQYQYRVQVCHRTHSKKKPWHTITVSVNALKAHLKHGDTLGACAAAAPAAPKTNGKSGDQHGKGKK
jgi:hypothetical protein